MKMLQKILEKSKDKFVDYILHMRTLMISWSRPTCMNLYNYNFNVNIMN